MRVARCCQPHAFQTRVARGIPGGSVVALLAEASGCVPCSCKKHRSHLQSQSRSAARGPNEQLPGRRLCRANSSEGMVQPLAGHCREFPARTARCCAACAGSQRCALRERLPEEVSPLSSPKQFQVPVELSWRNARLAGRPHARREQPRTSLSGPERQCARYGADCSMRALTALGLQADGTERCEPKARASFRRHARAPAACLDEQGGKLPRIRAPVPVPGRLARRHANRHAPVVAASCCSHRWSSSGSRWVGSGTGNASAAGHAVAVRVVTGTGRDASSAWRASSQAISAPM